MGTRAAGAERGAVERLRQDEASLERGVAEARRLAAELLEGARREAEAIAAAARRDAAGLADRLRDEAAEALDRMAAEERAAAEAELTAIASRAAANRDRALERVVALALGERP